MLTNRRGESGIQLASIVTDQCYGSGEHTEGAPTASLEIE